MQAVPGLQRQFVIDFRYRDSAVNGIHIDQSYGAGF